jgi:hypothetical protein
MKMSSMTFGTHSEFSGMKVAEYHDGGFSSYNMAYGDNMRDVDGHLYLSGKKPETSNPKDKGFSISIHKFASAMDYAEATTRAERIMHPTNSERLKHIRRMESGSSWYNGFKKFDDGYKMVCDGWEEGARRALTNLSSVNVPEINGIESMRRTLVFSDYGETLNIDQAMSGNWEKAWQTCRRISSGVSRVLSIAIPFGGNCGKTSEQLFWNGAQGMVITDMLEDKGYRVNLIGFHVARQYGDYGEGGTVWDVDIIDLKRSDEPMRMDSIASVVAHAGVFRTAGFASIVMKPCFIGMGLGQCIEDDLPKHVNTLVSLGHAHPGTIVLDAAYSKEQAATRIKEFFERMKNGEIGSA